MHRRSLLDNGVRVVTEFIPHVRSATVGFWYRVGSRDEAPDKNGISHFIEHLMFKGTKNRSARQIAQMIDASGGQMNAYTSKEHTCFYARVLDAHVDLAVDVLTDMLRNSVFSPPEIQKEKGVILEEIKMYEDTPDELVHDLMAVAALGDHPLGRPVLGHAEAVVNFQRDDVMDFLAQNYNGSNLVVAGAGRLDHDEFVERIEDSFGDLQKGIVRGTQIPPNAARRRLIRGKDTEQVHLCLGTPSLRRNHPDRFALHILDVALGGGMSSRFFQQLREERGLVYSTYTYHSSFQETGLFTVYAGTSPEHAEEVLHLIEQGLKDAVRHGCDEDEIVRAKEQLKGSLMLGLEHSANRMSRLAQAALFMEEMLSPDELIARIDAVTLDDVRTVTERIFNGQSSLAVIGPVDDSFGRGIEID